MTEIHGAIGLAQLKKLDMIIESQRANKAKLITGLSELDVPFRNSLDPDGDISDTIVFYMPNRETTDKFVAAMRVKGLGTKNLPDAIGWHFSKHWKHLLDDHPLYGGNLDTSWTKSADILECSVALPVGVFMDDTRISEITSTILKIGKNLL
jgi:8-amino-3,8-dideoxy-alpha-D-manno-octulosonate transaminase